MAGGMAGGQSTRHHREDISRNVAEDRPGKSQNPVRSIEHSLAHGLGALMTALALDQPAPTATDGEIAAINLESARRNAWARFERDPRRPGAAEAVVDYERLAAQFLGDCDALDR